MWAGSHSNDQNLASIKDLKHLVTDIINNHCVSFICQEEN